MGRHQSTPRIGPGKAYRKPRPDFPLFPHASGRWAKKVRGKFVYFGKVADDPDGERALNLWLDQRDALLAGRKPRDTREGVSLKLLCNSFLTQKLGLINNGELSQRTLDDYKLTCARIMDHFGDNRLVIDIDQTDFESLRTSLAKTRGPVSLANEVSRVRVVFKYAHDSGLIPNALRFGPGFKRPSKKTLRLNRHARGRRFLDAADLRKVIDASAGQMKAMIYLGLNCGFGNADVGRIQASAFDLKKGWVHFPRPKTGIDRRCPLWKETIAEIRKVLFARTPSAGGLLFVTKYGHSWAKESRDNPVSKEFVKILKSLNLHRAGLGFYLLRHVFETVGGEARDQVAVDAIMGHSDASMASEYREGVSDERLLAVTTYVRDWLLSAPGKSPR